MLSSERCKWNTRSTVPVELRLITVLAARFRQDPLRFLRGLDRTPMYNLITMEVGTLDI